MGTKGGEGGVWGQPTPFNLKRGLGVPMTPFCSIFSEQIPQNKETLERGRGGWADTPSPWGRGRGVVSGIPYLLRSPGARHLPPPNSRRALPRGPDLTPLPRGWGGSGGGPRGVQRGAWYQPEERAAESQDCGQGGEHGSREGSGPGPHGNEVRGEESSA